MKDRERQRKEWFDRTFNYDGEPPEGSAAACFHRPRYRRVPLPPGDSPLEQERKQKLKDAISDNKACGNRTVDWILGKNRITWRCPYCGRGDIELGHTCPGCQSTLGMGLKEVDLSH